MKANPGGQISPYEVVGRDELIQRLWSILNGRSLILCSVRRMGKTSVIKKMAADAPQDRFLAIYQELEGIYTPVEFAKAVFYGVKDNLGRLKRNIERTRQFFEQFGGLGIGGIIKLPDEFLARHWKTLLTSAIEDLVKQEHRTVILFWDEVPMMLDNIKQRSDEGVVIEILNTLRSLRQTHQKLRMVFTGSIGLHHVITSLKHSDHTNAPMINDMKKVDVPSLSPKNAQKLARLLLEGERISTVDPCVTAQAIAEVVDGNPYYIHHVVSQMQYRNVPENGMTVREIVGDCLRNENDPWELSNYRDRIGIRYPPKEQTFALKLLDILSDTEYPLTFDDLFNLLKSLMATEDREMAQHVLRQLQRDYYIQQTDGAYRFRFPLIQRWWRLDKGLTP